MTDLVDSTLDVASLKTSYSLGGPAPKFDGNAHTRAVRGDVAHIRYAGQVFVSHYAVPMPRTVVAGGATLRTAGRAEAEEIGTLAAGETFNLLDSAGGWGWGQQGEDGLVGYLLLTALEP